VPRVKEDDPLVEILTDKANVEIPSPVSGTVMKILASPGQVVKVGELLALIEPGAVKAAAAGRRGSRDPGRPETGEGSRGGFGRRSRYRPRETGDRGRRAAGGKAGRADGTPPESASEERIPFKGKRRMIARKMVAAKRPVSRMPCWWTRPTSRPHGRTHEIRETGEWAGVRITILPFIMKAVAGALRLHPALNASLDEDRGEIVLKKKVDVGMAVDAEDGLVVPVVRNADAKSIIELAGEIERLSAAAREGALAPGDQTGGTFTISSVGSIGGPVQLPRHQRPGGGHPGGA